MTNARTLGRALLMACVIAAGCDGGVVTPDGGAPPDDGGADPTDAGADGAMPPPCVEDMCGTCDLDPSNDCVEDCAGAWGGTATEDECGTCDSDPANDCIADCAGTWGGDAVPDMCGTCDADATNDCVQDCAGAWGGSATVDACGTCDADPTNDCDCAGTPGGTATVDMCGTCDADPSNDCTLDCAGVWGGPAMLDGCGTCDADPTNDCPNDCAGTPGGPARLDMCGTCDTDPSNDCALDCAGAWGGSATTDMCGTCDADPSNDCTADCTGAWGGSATTDMCGTCDADPANDCVQDCAGVWGGAAALDACGRCAGGTSGVTACPTVVLYPVADASVWEGHADANHGTEPILHVISENDPLPITRRAFLRFDLSALPAGAVVRGVTFEAHAYDGFAVGGDGNMYTRFVEDDAWSETGITWSNQPPSLEPNLGHWWLWYGPPSHQIGRNSDPALVPVIQRELEGDSLVSLMIYSPGYDTYYRSREHSDPTQRPALIIGYLPSTTVTLEAVADTYVRPGSSTNYGTEAMLQVDRGNARTYARFDLSSVPATAEVVSAELTMTAYSGLAYGGDGNVYVHLVSDGWDEATLNGTNEPTASSDPLGSWWLWYDLGDTRVQNGRLGGEPLRAAVEAETQGDRAFSVRLNSPGYRTDYRSREHTDAAQRPSLTIRYVLP